MKIVEEIALSGTENGNITVAILEEPYGAGSEAVASIAVSLQANGDEPDWKVHIPVANIDALINALTKAKESL
jgi:hypothetical protein